MVVIAVSAAVVEVAVAVAVAVAMAVAVVAVAVVAHPKMTPRWPRMASKFSSGSFVCGTIRQQSGVLSWIHKTVGHWFIPLPCFLDFLFHFVMLLGPAMGQPLHDKIFLQFDHGEHDPA